ncbi:Bicoid-interacting protein 3-domain-containing protein [Gautieria morchelliformis]|nr:Bicoid-interacting protein 3-domain-containing protein [Gautieria morchelliformis]
MSTKLGANGGQPVHGNYRGYYTKRPFVKDPRLALLPSQFFSDAVVLDVGCNEGWVTCEIAQQWGAKKVIGVDIDPELIRAAWRRRLTVWSLQTPEVPPHSYPPQKKRKRDDTPSVHLHSYFPQSMEHMFGPLPIPGRTFDSQEKFPHNISFHTADWVEHGLPEDRSGYDIVIALSISKWIHLNVGDDGLVRFFRRVSDVLRRGGKFILEPQPWETYAKAKRMDIRLKETANLLKIRPEGFPELLAELGFSKCERLGVTGEGGFRRPVDMYIKD